MPRPEVLSAVPTMFAADGTLDLAANRRLAERLRDRLDGVFAAGTTGEFPALSDDERLALFEIALDVWGPDRVIAHVGSAATSQTVTLAGRARALGVTRLAALPPYYFAVDEPDIAEHFAAVHAAADGAEVYAYLFAERTGVDVSPALFARLVDAGSVSGAKISGAAAERIGDYVTAVAAGARLWAGTDVALPAVAAAGAVGVVSGLSAVAPAQVVALADSVAADDAVTDDRVAAVRAVSETIGPWPAGLKAALARLGIGTPVCRMLQGADSRVDPEAVERAVALLA